MQTMAVVSSKRALRLSRRVRVLLRKAGDRHLDVEGVLGALVGSEVEDSATSEVWTVADDEGMVVEDIVSLRSQLEGVLLGYAVLGDIARAKGKLDEAAKMYAYAAQMDPRNPIYQQRHEELINTYRDKRNPSAATKATQKSVMTIIVGTLLVVSAGLYVMLAKEPIITPGLSLINTWTLGLVIMLFLSGVSTGAVLCAGDYIDRFNASTIVATGRISSPILMLAMVAVVNFWAAAVLYALVTITQRGFTVSHLRFMIGIGVTTLIMAGAAALSIANFAPLQVLLWGGNLAYLGGICGWMVADSFKRI